MVPNYNNIPYIGCCQKTPVVQGVVATPRRETQTLKCGALLRGPTPPPTPVLQLQLPVRQGGLQGVQQEVLVQLLKAQLLAYLLKQAVPMEAAPARGSAPLAPTISEAAATSWSPRRWPGPRPATCASAAAAAASPP